MNRTLQALKLDFIIIKSLLFLSIAVCYVFAITISVAVKQPVTALVIATIISVYVGGTVFSIIEKNNCSRLYAVLPLGRPTVVAARYLFALVIGVANLIFAGVCSLIISLIIRAAIDPLTFFAAISLMFIYYCLAVGVSYPVFFACSFAKASISAFAPWFVIIFGLVLLSKMPGAFDGLAPAIAYFRDHLFLLPICGGLIGLILLAVSALIANVIYKRKEI